MKSYTVRGIVIKRADRGEADKVVTLLTQEKGKISLVAKGVRKLSSRRAGSLELFNQVKTSAVSGRGPLDVLTEVSVMNSFSSWRRYLGRVNIAYQLCEVVDKILPENQPQPVVFNILSESLASIPGLGRDWQQRLDSWLLDILIELGYWPRDRVFTGDLDKFIESITQRAFNSPKILKKLT